MAVVLAYVDAVPGRLYPLVATLLELTQRGHRVAVRCGIDDVERLRSVGLEARSLRREIERFEPDDWRARTRFGALSSGLGQFGERARFQLLDLEQAIEAEHPDVLFVDEGAWGAAAAAERSGLPWVFSIVSPVPLPSRDAPPFGLGLRPRHDRLGRLRDSAGEAADARNARARDRQTHEPAARRDRASGRSDDRGRLPRRLGRDRLHRGAVRVPALGLAGQAHAGRAWSLGAAGGSSRVAGQSGQAARARHLLDPLPERPSARRGRHDRARRRAVRGRRHDRRRRPDGRSGGAERSRRALPPARAAARASSLRRLPRRHGDHPEGARARRAGRRRPLRSRPARGRAPRGIRGCRGEASCAEADARSPPRRGAPRDRATARRRADRSCVRPRRRRRGRGGRPRRAPPARPSRTRARSGGGPAAAADRGPLRRHRRRNAAGRCLSAIAPGRSCSSATTSSCETRSSATGAG